MTILVTDGTTKAEIAEAIRHLRTRYNRMPTHWTDRRQVIADEVDHLVTEWLTAKA